MTSRQNDDGADADLESCRGFLDEAEDGSNVTRSAMVWPGRELVLDDLPHPHPALLLVELAVPDPQHPHREVGLQVGLS